MKKQILPIALVLIISAMIIPRLIQSTPRKSVNGTLRHEAIRITPHPDDALTGAIIVPQTFSNRNPRTLQA